MTRAPARRANWKPDKRTGVGYGLGFAGNTHRHVPDGWLPAVKFLVEELGEVEAVQRIQRPDRHRIVVADKSQGRCARPLQDDTQR